MAKKEEKSKIVLERTYNVPLRKEYLKAPNWKRTPKAVRALRSFLIKHMKSEDIRIGKYANAELWKHGIKNPPHHIKVQVTKDSEGVVVAELVGAVEKIDEPQKKKVLKKLAKESIAAKKPKKEEKKVESQKSQGDLKSQKEEKAVEISVKDALGGKEESLEAAIEEKKEEKAEEAKKIEKEEIKELKKEKPKAHAPKPVAKEAKVEQHPNAPMKK